LPQSSNRPANAAPPATAPPVTLRKSRRFIAAMEVLFPRFVFYREQPAANASAATMTEPVIQITFVMVFFMAPIRGLFSLPAGMMNSLWPSSST